MNLLENVEVLAKWASAIDFNNVPMRDVDGFTVPAFWSDNASMICRTRYARKPLNERSALQVCERVAGGWARSGVVSGHIEPAQYKQFKHIATCIMLFQLAAPNSPQWFNTGCYDEGMEQASTGNWVYRPGLGAFQPDDAYKYPQVHACFIQSVSDSMLGDGSIMDLWTRETTVFKHGSGSGSNISSIREKGAPLSGGGTSSGVMSFLSVGDKNAGAIKSGGTNRRAALMRTMDIDHPDIIDFVRWKRDEEAKVAYLAEGSKIVSAAVKAIKEGSAHNVSPEVANRIQGMIENGIIDGQFAEMDTGWTSEAYATVDGQNSNNSIMITDAFMQAVEDDSDWELTSRVDGSVVKTVKARYLFDEICQSAWLSADPAVQFYDTINRENTVPNDGHIHASNPCSEYLFIDDNACNLASVNLAAISRMGNLFATLERCGYDGFEQMLRDVVYFMTIVLDISVDMASYPSEKLAKNAYEYRTVGIGFTALGEYLAINAIAYASEQAEQRTGEIMSEIFESALHASVNMAEKLGPCASYERNKYDVREVYRVKLDDWYDFDHDYNLTKHGVRNMQLTNIAPTGTISFVMDAGSTGIEPVYSLASWKTLAEGGGMFIAAPYVESALSAMLVDDDEIAAFVKSVESGVPDFNLISECDREQAKALLAGSMDVSPEWHLRIMAACQEYVCGAISKTVNLPADATVDDIKDVYIKAHKMGIKCVSVYRDGSKLSQPMNAPAAKIDDAPVEPVSATNAPAIDRTGKRNPMPLKRKGYTQKAKIDNQTIYIRTGEYADGSIGEIFLDMQKEGSAYGGLLSAFAQSVSIGLQYGVPLSEFIDAFAGSRIEPRGFVFGHDEIKTCTSVLDYVFRDLQSNYTGESTESASERVTEPIRASSDHVTYELDNAPRECCAECGGFSLVATGVCKTCRDCGATTGCG